jgi:hypothetical protein
LIARLYLLKLAISAAVMLGLTAAGGAFFSFLACAVAQRRLGKTDTSSRKILKRRMRHLFLNRALVVCCMGIGAGLVLYLVLVLAFSTPVSLATLGYVIFPMIFVSQAWAIALTRFPRTINQPLIDPPIDHRASPRKSPVKPEDLEWLRSIRGRFGETKLYRLGIRLTAFFFFALALLFVGMFFRTGIPHWPLSSDRWFCVVSVPLGIAGAVFFWRTSDIEYEFTGTEIIKYRSGTVQQRIPVAEIVTTEILGNDGVNMWLSMQTGTTKLLIRLMPSLLAKLKERYNG